MKSDGINVGQRGVRDMDRVSEGDGSKTLMQIFTEEYESCQLPLVANADREKVSTRRLLEDVHMMLSGNGGPSRGVVYKLAETRATQRVVRADLTGMNKTLDDQIKFCREVQETHNRQSDIAEAEKRGAMRVLRPLWKHRVGIGMIVVAGLMYLYSIFSVKENINKTMKSLVEDNMLSIIRGDERGKQ